MYYGILVILPNVVVYKDVLDRLVKGVDPQRLPPTNGEGISSPPGRETHREQIWKMTYDRIQDPKLSMTSGWSYTPIKVILKAPQALDCAQILVQASFPITGRHPVFSSAQDDSSLVAADLARSHIHI